VALHGCVVTLASTVGANDGIRMSRADESQTKEGKDKNYELVCENKRTGVRELRKLGNSPIATSQVPV
jgi:hypothetical protein